MKATATCKDKQPAGTIPGNPRPIGRSDQPVADVWIKFFMGSAPAKTLENKPNLAPEPLLDLFENYRGSFHDLDRGLKLDGAQMRAAHDALGCRFHAEKIPSGPATAYCWPLVTARGSWRGLWPS